MNYVRAIGIVLHVVEITEAPHLHEAENTNSLVGR
jgi:hypothetical protein